jgi:hypothetical protein
MVYYMGNNNRIQQLIGDLTQVAQSLTREWVYKPNQESGTLPASRHEQSESFLHSKLGVTTEKDRIRLLKKLEEMLRDEKYLIQNQQELGLQASSANGGHSRAEKGPIGSDAGQQQNMESNSHHSSSNSEATGGQQSPRRKRRLQGFQEVFKTAPSSPTPSPSATASLSPDSPSWHRHVSPPEDDYDDPEIDTTLLTLADSFHGDQTSPRKEKQTKINEHYPSTARRDSGLNADNGIIPPPPLSQRTQQRQLGLNGFLRESKFTSTPDDLSECKNSRRTSGAGQSFATTATAAGSFGLFSVNGGASTVATSFASGRLKASQEEDLESHSSTVADFQQFLAADVPAPVPQVAVKDPIDLEIQKVVDALEADGPFAKSRTCRSKIPFRYRYEAQRIADAYGKPVPEVVPRENLPYGDYHEFWNHIETQCRSGPKQQVLKTPAVAWQMATDNYCDTTANNDDVVILSGQLDWCEISEPGMFKFKLNPLRFERGYRLCRRFGSDRFLEISFPALAKFPRHIKRRYGEDQVLLRSISRWLASSEHYIAGRKWRGVFLEDIKKKLSSKKAPNQSKCYLFAVDGDDFIRSSSPAPAPRGQTSDRRTPMSLRALVNWHIPLKENHGQPDCKLFQRLKLGLSRTFPTVEVLPDEILELEDDEDEDKPVMNDGCALMSRSLAIRVAEHLGLDGTPSCFQARIAGAKGIWMVDLDDKAYNCGDRQFWIQISSSQLKIKPHPCYNKVPLDDEQLTFEVVSWSRPLRPANLNLQLLMVLQEGGVCEKHLESLIERELDLYYEDFKKVVTSNNSIAARRWLQAKARDVLTAKHKTRQLDGFPAAYPEQAILLVESGFLPLHNGYLNGLFRTLLYDELTRFDELKVPISCSTYVYCIADPYGVLKEDEVQLAFSRPWDKHGSYDTELDGIDILVARSPAHLPSDVQKQRTVFKKELRHFRDVIVFPTVGDHPLAGKLSGGDYDGDETWVCWDPAIVDAFTNTPFDPAASLSAKDLGLWHHARPMTDYNLFGQKTSDGFDNFMAKVFSFNAVPSPLGICTNEHEKLCYKLNGINSPAALKLAHLLGCLVDASKSGYELTREHWQELRAELGLHSLRIPAYKDQEPRTDYNLNNIIDYLRFKVVKDKVEQIQEDFAGLSRDFSVDDDLTAVWEKFWARAITDRHAYTKESVFCGVLGEMKKAIEDAKHSWSRVCKSMPYQETIEKAAEFLGQVELPSPPGRLHPSPQTTPISLFLDTEEAWAELRASYAYKRFHHGAFAWLAAGPVLCRIKARATGPLRTTIQSVYATFKVDGRKAERLLEDARRADAELEEAEAEAGADEVITPLVEGDSSDSDAETHAESDYVDADDGPADPDAESQTETDEDDWVSLA